MIRAEKFRIGNYVNFKDREDIDYCSIEELSRTGCHIFRYFKDGLYNDDQPEAIKDITGIRITDEWLERLGFKKLLLGVHKLKSNTNYELHNKINLLEYVHGEFRSVGHSVKYIHELQNRYFSLSGMELKIIQ